MRQWIARTIVWLMERLGIMRRPKFIVTPRQDSDIEHAKKLEMLLNAMREDDDRYCADVLRHGMSVIYAKR